MLHNNECPICHRTVKSFRGDPLKDRDHVECYHCGKYSIDGSASVTIGEINKSQKDVVKIAHWILEHPGVFINDNMIREKSIVSEELEPFIRAEKLFIHICSSIPELGQKLDIGPINEEITAFIENKIIPIDTLPPSNQSTIQYNRIVGVQFLSITMSTSLSEIDTLLHDFLWLKYKLIKIDNGAITITPDGWKYYNEEKDRINSKSQIFIAMSFEELIIKRILPLIKEAINNTGYNPLCMYEYNHNEIIDFEMIKQIKESKLVIADLTHGNNGAYFEAGLGEGFGTKIILTAHANCLEKDSDDPIHFDTNHRLITKWEFQEGKEIHKFVGNLEERILIALGPGNINE